MSDVRSYFQGIDLDSGGGTDLVLAVNLRLSNAGGSIEALGQKAMASSIPVVIASDQASFGVSIVGGTLTGILNTVTVDSELPAAAALADATANPTVPGVGGFLMGYNGTTWDRVRVANTGRLQVDVVTGGGSDTPTNPVTSYVTIAGLTAGSVDTLTTPEAAAKKLAQVEVWASVAFKAFVHTVDNGSESASPIAVGGGQAFAPFIWKAPHRNYATLGTTAGLDAFRVKITNLDDANAADVYATFHYED